jgi:hypothetical protein
MQVVDAALARRCTNVFDFGSDSGTFIAGNSVTLQTVKAGVN